MSASSKARLASANILAKDIDGLSQFYSKLFGFSEMASEKSPIYRGLDAGGTKFGFNDYAAYELLGVQGREPAVAGLLNVYLTFEVSSGQEIDDLASQAAALGGKIIKAPYETYYNARQAVLEDPEGHVFRINFRR